MHFSSTPTTLNGSTPVVLASWTRGLVPFEVQIGGTGQIGASGDINYLYISTSPTATAATAMNVFPFGTVFKFTVPAGFTSDTLYGFTVEGMTLDTAVFLNRLN